MIPISLTFSIMISFKHFYRLSIANNTSTTDLMNIVISSIASAFTAVIKLMLISYHKINVKKNAILYS